MYGAEKFHPWLKRPVLEKKDSAPPDYAPMAQASAESAQIMGDLGQQQIDFAKQQYAETKPILSEIAQQQLAIGNQSMQQGQDYYEYLKSYRPTERSMMYESMGFNPDEMSQLETLYYDNAQAGLDENGLLAGRAAEVEALSRQLGLIPQSTTTTTETSSTSSTTPAANKGQSVANIFAMFNPLVRAARSNQGSGPVTTEETLSRITAANPQYAEAINNLTTAQKQLLVEQANASIAASQRDLDYEQAVSGFGTTAAARRASELGAYDAANKADAATMTMDPTQLYEQRRAEIEPMVAQAIADTQGGYTRSLNQAMRQGLRYGGGYNQIAANAGSLGIAQAQQTATAANTARTAGIEGVRGRAALGLQTRQSNMGALNKEKAIDWAKKLDATGLVRGMPGASTGAYGLAVSSGNAAGQNTMAPGQQMQAGLAAGAGTIGQGRQLYQSGLGSILNSQTSVYNTDTQAAGEMWGSILGAGATLGAAYMSDRRAKENIEAIGTDAKTGLTLYEFNYIADPDTRYRGVMADEVEQVFPDAVIELLGGMKAVDYARLGIEMVAV